MDKQHVVLVIEDEPEHRELIRELLSRAPGEPFDVVEADSVKTACEALEGGSFSAILLDHSLPDGHGTEVLERMELEMLATPVIGLSTSVDPEVAISDFRGGAVDFIKKQTAFRGDALKRCVIEAITRHRRRAMAELLSCQDLARSVEESTEQLVAESRTDGLTGLLNRRAFDDMHSFVHDAAVSGGSSYVLAFLDIDHFKSFNDTYGHSAGDRAIQAVSNAIQATDSVIAGRYGGEEFVVIIEDVPSRHAFELCESIRRSVEHLRIEHRGNAGHDVVTVSLGVTSVTPGDDRSTMGVITDADDALYVAKSEGRNQIRVAERDGQ